MNLDERKKKILASVVEGYIASAEPVGSKTLVEKYNLDYSPATIRNEMKILEDSGFLEQPHVSAGRVPSSKGYRYYVDNLMKTNSLSMMDINYIDSTINGYGNTEQLLSEVAGTVSKILERPTILTLNNEEILESIKVLKISEKVILIILFSENGVIKDVIAKLTDTVPDSSIDELTKVLNKNLQGTPIEKLYNVLNSVITKELNSLSGVMDKITEELSKQPGEDAKVINNNIESVLSLPEFNDLEKAKTFINMLSTKKVVNEVLEKAEKGELGIVIGSESKEIMLKDLSVISLNISNNDKVLGSISVVSPTRMDYSKTVSTLQYINEKVKSIFSKEKDDGLLDKKKKTKKKGKS